MVRKEYGPQVSFRLKKDKAYLRDEFYTLVVDQLGSDTCFVHTCLMEAFVQAFKQVPNPENLQNPFEIKFLRQNVQVNIGCNMNYFTKKARRIPAGAQEALSKPTVELDRNHVLPLLLELWPTLSEKSRAFWRQRLEEAGIIPTSEIQPPGSMHIASEENNSNHPGQESMEQCVAIASKDSVDCVECGSGDEPGFWRRFWRVWVTPVEVPFWRNLWRVMTTPL